MMQSLLFAYLLYLTFDAPSVKLMKAFARKPTPDEGVMKINGNKHDVNANVDEALCKKDK